MVGIIVRLKTWLVKLLELMVILIVGVLVVDVIWGVFTRYVLGHQSPWTEELAKMLLIWVSLLGASVGFIRESHLGVDYFVGKLSPRWQVFGRLAVYVLTVAFAVVVLIYGGCKLVALTLENGQPSPAMNIQMGYVYLAIPISGVFIVLFSIELLIKSIGSLKKASAT